MTTLDDLNGYLDDEAYTVRVGELRALLSASIADTAGAKPVALSAEQKQTLLDLLQCYRSWQPQVRVLGNVRADAAIDAIRAALTICGDKNAAQSAAMTHEEFDKKLVEYRESRSIPTGAVLFAELSNAFGLARAKLAAPPAPSVADHGFESVWNRARVMDETPKTVAKFIWSAARESTAPSVAETGYAFRCDGRLWVVTDPEIAEKWKAQGFKVVPVTAPSVADAAGASEFREAGVWDPDGKKFRTYRNESLNGKAMYLKESK